MLSSFQFLLSPPVLALCQTKKITELDGIAGEADVDLTKARHIVTKNVDSHLIL